MFLVTVRGGTNDRRLLTRLLLGFLDAGVSSKVGAHHGEAKDRLGGHHASQQGILDFSFPKTLPLERMLLRLRDGLTSIRWVEE